MVTRYTIDNILSHKDGNRENHRFKASRSPPPLSTSISGDLEESGVVLRRGDVEIRKVFENPLVEQGRRTPQGFRTSDVSHSYRNSCDDADFEKRGLDDEERKSCEEPPVQQSILRPVPVRPSERPIGSLSERSSPSGSDMGTLSDSLHNTQGYNFGRMDVGSSVYRLMFQQLVETQLRGLATSGAFPPLAHSMIDPALPHLVGGVNLPYPLTTRSRRRGGQVRFTGEQTRQLEAWFHLHKYITPPQRKTIARELNLQERQVKTWFQNRRAKWRKAEGQTGGDVLAPEDVHSPSTIHEANTNDQSRDLYDEDMADEEEELQSNLIANSRPRDTQRTLINPMVNSMDEIRVNNSNYHE